MAGHEFPPLSILEYYVDIFLSPLVCVLPILKFQLDIGHDTSPFPDHAALRYDKVQQIVKLIIFLKFSLFLKCLGFFK